MKKRTFLIVLDGVGAGALPDADKFDDIGSNTLLHIIENFPHIKIPNLFNLGLGNILSKKDMKKNYVPSSYGKAKELSAGKDTTTGHWEIAGIILEKPFPTYPNGFPPEIIEPFEKLIGRKILGNKPASGTEIIKELGLEHLKTGYPIVYTSADSVFQIAAHEKVIPVEQLYEMCKIARKLLKGKHNVCRVIARPFIGEYPNFIRTDKRKDFSVPPPKKTLLNFLKDNGLDVIAIGKIYDIFAGSGITKSYHTHDNNEGMDINISLLDENFEGLAFTNLVDFDMKYGHRRNTKAFAKALEEFDEKLGIVLKKLKPLDTLILTADHGCDPTFKGTDHTREYIPIIALGYGIAKNYNLGIRKTFADIAATISDIFKIPNTGVGESFFKI